MMIRSRSGRAPLVYLVVTCAVSVALAPFVASCSISEREPIFLGDGFGDGSATPSFTDGLDSGTNDASGLVSYCPSNKCPEGWTTCPNSRFPCDVNLLRDVDNCGACGNACPASPFFDKFTCNNGACAVQCNAQDLKLDCDGLPDNGCETHATTNRNCGACGKECTDPAMPCVHLPVAGNTWQCGCPAGKNLCNGACVDKDDDKHCGACTNKCDPTADGGPPPANAYYGCAKGQCGALKCKNQYGNCDGVTENGCETPLDTNENCGVCGNACPGGQACRVGPDQKAQCMCPPGLTFCASGMSGNLEQGTCVDIATDQQNCGACDVKCAASYNTPTSVSACKYGTCVTACNDGLADCNNSRIDGCEVDTISDPRNCGGCGVLCDAVAGQACVAGRCVVEPCSVDAGGGSAR